MGPERAKDIVNKTKRVVDFLHRVDTNPLLGMRMLFNLTINALIHSDFTPLKEFRGLDLRFRGTDSPNSIRWLINHAHDVCMRTDAVPGCCAEWRHEASERFESIVALIGWVFYKKQKKR